MKINIYILFFICTFIVYTGSYAQNSDRRKASLIVSSAEVIEVPSIASQIANGTFVPAVDENKIYNPKKWGKSTSIPGKGFPKGGDPLVQEQMKAAMTPGKAPILTFNAATASATPTDPTGAVGPNHFVNSWNSSFRIWDKSGNALTPAASLGTIFPGTLGDPIVMYDRYADRFFISEFFNNGFDVAVSQGPDPVNDGWYVYRFNTNTFPDYPKYSVWSDGYYITANKDQGSPTTSEVVFALERDAMLVGDPSAQMIGFSLPGIVTSGFYSPLGFNCNGPNLPPAGNAPIVYMQDDSWAGVSTDHLKIWSVNVNWSSPGSSSISGPQIINTTPFDGLFDSGSFSNLPQPSGSDIDALQATIMYMAQYRRFATHNSVVFNFVVDLDGSDDYSGIRWYELRQASDGAPWTIYQEGTYAQPGGHSAFSGNMCMDASGNIALAYTCVSTTLYPSLRYTGRFASDPLNTMTMTEEVIGNGNASDPSFRYGDYAQMTIDPTDDATFWSIGEYFPNGQRTNRVGVFQFAPPALTAEFSATSTDVCTGSSVTFTDLSLGTPTSWNWSFPGGSPSSYNGQNPPPITYNTPGTYDVTLVVGDGSTTDPETKTGYIVVADIIAGFSGSPTTVVVGNSVTFTDNSSCNPTSWTWSFPGGSPSSYNGQNPPAITYNSIGTYNVSLTVNNGSGSDIETKVDYIEVTDISYCIPPYTTGTGEGDFISLVQLGSINNSTGASSSPYYTYYNSLSTDLITGNSYSVTVSAGTYTSGNNITVWIDFNHDGNFDTSEKLGNVTLGAQPETGTINFSVPTGATPGTTRMRAREVWNTTGIDPCNSYSYGETEDYDVNIISNTVPPVADFTADNLTPFTGQTVSFTDLSSSSPTSWSWSFNPSTVTFVGGTNAGSQNPQVQFNDIGLYTVTLIATNSYGSDDEIKSNYIQALDPGTCTYCTSVYTNTSDDWISNVTFESINNSSGSVGYEDFTSLVANIQAGQSYPIDVEVTVTGNWLQYAWVWIDWNKNCDFTDAGEAFSIGVTPGSTGTFVLSGTIIVPSGALSGPTRMRVSERYNIDPGPCDQSTFGETEDYTVNVQSGTNVQLTAFLEGPFNGLSMNPDLIAFLPLDQPFNTSPWNYTGTESVTSIPSPQYIGWVLVELRDASSPASANAASMIARQAAFLSSDGSIIGVDGNPVLSFDESVSNNLYVVIHHRNHLSIMAANALAESEGVYSYDFSTGVNQVYGGLLGHKEVAPGVWAMIAADGNSDGSIDNLDKNSLWENEAGNTGLLNSDYNLDGESNNIDKDDYWFPNFGKGTQVPN
ncbi:MAG: PKD domain-containing protein [Bacteroidales bacterium]|nr:PKD domain-containing protein [Bacteroidales bacterium]